MARASGGSGERDGAQDRIESRRLRVWPLPGVGSDTSQLWISPSEIRIAFLRNAIKRRWIQMKLRLDPAELGAGVYVVTADGIFASTLRSIPQLRNLLPGRFCEVRQGVAICSDLVRGFDRADDAKFIPVQLRMDEPGSFRIAIRVKCSRRGYKRLREDFGVPRARSRNAEVPISVAEQPDSAPALAVPPSESRNARMAPTFLSRRDDVIVRFAADSDETLLAPGVVARRAQELPSPHADVWFLLAAETGAARVNGVPVATGIVALDHKDEVATRDGARWFVSFEKVAAVAPFPGAAITRCARCRLELLPGTPAVTCPRCGIWTHESSELACFSYGDCPGCGGKSELGGDLEWRAEEEA